MADDTDIHCESPVAATRTTCDVPRRSPTYPVSEFLRISALPRHPEFGKLCYPCLSRLGDFIQLACEQRLATGPVPRP